MAVLIAVEIVFGSMTYAKLDDFHEKVHLWIFWAIQRHYGHDVSNTTIVDLIQQNVNKTLSVTFQLSNI